MHFAILYQRPNVSNAMSVDPRDLWAALPPALRRKIVDDVAAVLAEVSREVRTGQADTLGPQGGGLHSAVDAPPGGLKQPAPRNRWTHDPRLLSAPELATRLEIPVNWLYVQIRQKRLLTDRQPTGAYLFQDTPAVLNAIRNLRNQTISHLDLRICQPHQGGHQHA